MPRLLPLILLLAACGSAYEPNLPGNSAEAAAPAAPAAERVETAVFAGGCFWCTEADFEKVEGVVSAVSGYTGGHTQQPTYEQVTAGGTGHYEAVLVRYDPAKVTYDQLARYYFLTVDPTDAGGQFCDRGESYRTALFVAGAEQRREAEAAKKLAAAKVKGRIVTPVLPRGRFWPAETYHQDYYKKNPIRYRFYRSRCGRDARLEALWGG